MAASQPACWPTHSCLIPTALKMSSLMTDSTALPIILLETSPIPIGLTPGCLSSAMSLLQVKPLRALGSTRVEHMRRATAATASHKRWEAFGTSRLRNTLPYMEHSLHCAIVCHLWYISKVSYACLLQPPL